MSAHSKTPWRYEVRGDNRFIIAGDKNPNGTDRVLMRTGDADYYDICPLAEADWLFIVHAVNNHASLLALAERCEAHLSEYVKCLEQWGAPVPRTSELLTDIRSIIERAKK